MRFLPLILPAFIFVSLLVILPYGGVNWLTACGVASTLGGWTLLCERMMRDFAIACQDLELACFRLVLFLLTALLMGICLGVIDQGTIAVSFTTAAAFGSAFASLVALFYVVSTLVRSVINVAVKFVAPKTLFVG